MQIPNNNKTPQNYQYPPQPYPQQNIQPQPYQYTYQPIYPQTQQYQYIEPIKYAKPVPPPKKPAPFSFEPGSNKELDEALNSIDFMYNDMFDTIDNQKLKKENEESQPQQFCMGIPIEPQFQGQNFQQYQDPKVQANIYQDPQKWNQYTKDSNSYY